LTIPDYVVGPAATLLVGLITTLGLLVVRKLRGPVTVQDLWAENRQLRTDLDAVSQKVDGLVRYRETQLTVNRIMGEGFDALSGYVERTSAEAGVKPEFTSAEHDAVERARALRSNDELWNTLQQNPPTHEGAQHG
jgi:hypothetical protein